jgi:hypothetical protein
LNIYIKSERKSRTWLKDRAQKDYQMASGVYGTVASTCLVVNTTAHKTCAW